MRTDTKTAAGRVGEAIARWWAPEIPLGRVAAVRALIYAWVIYDVLFVASDVLTHGYVPHLYHPTMLARWAALPALGVWSARVLLAVIIASCLLAISGRAQRSAGWTAAISFWIWMFNSQGYSYVSHDHLALMVAVAVLPSIGVARSGEETKSRAAGWAFRCIQICVVATYFLSAVAKWVFSGSLLTWANGNVFVWAISRRGSALISWTLHVPWLLKIGQWGLLAIEIASPVVLFLKGKWLYGAVGLFCLFHLTTYLGLGIHFLPTVVCWSTFLPMERLRPFLAKRIPALAVRSRGEEPQAGEGPQGGEELRAGH